MRTVIARYGQVHLVKPLMADVDMTVKLFNSATFLAAQIDFPIPFTREDAIKRIDTIPTRTKDLVLHVADQAGNTFGSITLITIDHQSRVCQMGVALLDEKHGQGYGTDAVVAICRHAFESYGLLAVQLNVQANNQVALRVYEKCGFTVDAMGAKTDQSGTAFECIYMSVTPETFLIPSR